MTHSDLFKQPAKRRWRATTRVDATYASYSMIYINNHDNVKFESVGNFKKILIKKSLNIYNEVTVPLIFLPDPAPP